MVYSYTTASLVEAEIRADAAFSSSTTPTLSSVNNWINEESALINLMTHEIYSSTTVSSTYVDYDGSGILRFPHAPLISITSIEYNVYGEGLASSWVALTEGIDKNYISYLDEGEACFVSGVNVTVNVLPRAGKQRLRLSYVYGYNTVPTEIQRLCTLMVAKRVIMSLINSQANSEGGEIQVGTIRVADPSNFSPNYVKAMTEEIRQAQMDMGSKLKTYRIPRVYD
jgi:hypothetical protein